MPKKKKSNKKKSFKTAKVEAGKGSDISCNITRSNKDQKHGPESSCKQGAKNSGNLEIKKPQKLAKNTKDKTYQEVQKNDKENTTIVYNGKIVDNISNPGYDDIRMQGTISRTIVNVDQNNLLLEKNDNQLNQIIPRNQKTQETGEANEIHKKHELISETISDFDSDGIKNDRKNIVNGDSNLTDNKMMRGGGASGNENLSYKEVAENEENRRKREFESCDTRKVGNISPFSTNVPLLYRLDTSEKQRFSDCLRESRNGKLVDNGFRRCVKLLANIVFSAFRTRTRCGWSVRNLRIFISQNSELGKIFQWILLYLRLASVSSFLSV